MKRFGAFAFSVALLAGLVVVGAQYEGYEWMPPGGMQLLGEVLEQCEDCAALSEISEMDLSVEEWEEYFRARTSSRADLSEEELEMGALAGLDERAIATLVNYVAIRLPAATENVSDLPFDGMVISVQYCTMCHAIAAAMTQDGWETSRWLDLLSHTTHSIIGLSTAEVEELTNYLSRNHVPMEEIPPPLREPMPGY